MYVCIYIHIYTHMHTYPRKTQETQERRNRIPLLERTCLQQKSQQASKTMYYLAGKRATAGRRMQTAGGCKLCRPIRSKTTRAARRRPVQLPPPAPQRASSDKKNRRRRLATCDVAPHNVSRCPSGTPSMQTTADEAGARHRTPSKKLGVTPPAMRQRVLRIYIYIYIYIYI